MHSVSFVEFIERCIIICGVSIRQKMEIDNYYNKYINIIIVL